jgi:glutathione S-transferase
MKLIEDPLAPNPRRVQIFLAEKGIQVPRERVKVMAEEHRTPAIRALNPVQLVPILVLDDGTALAETVAICRYFELLQPEPRLMGEGPLGQAKVEMWQRRMEFHLLFPVGHCFRHLHPRLAVLEQPQVAEWGEANRGKALETLGWLDGELAGRRFIAGEDFTIADITAFVACELARLARIDISPDLANVQRWRAEVAARPSAAPPAAAA